MNSLQEKNIILTNHFIAIELIDVPQGNFQLQVIDKMAPIDKKVYIKEDQNRIPSSKSIGKELCLILPNGQSYVKPSKIIGQPIGIAKFEVQKVIDCCNFQFLSEEKAAGFVNIKIMEWFKTNQKKYMDYRINGSMVLNEGENRHYNFNKAKDSLLTAIQRIGGNENSWFFVYLLD